MCRWSTICQTGYTFNSVTKQCEAIGISCGQNAKWNGAICCCNSGYNYIGGQCISCPAGTIFDGQSCSPILTNATITCGTNEVLSNGQCVCQIAVRAWRAAATRFSSAGFTSSHRRVFNPQSGFSQRRSLGITFAAARMRPTISSADGTRGECMSHTPGPMLFG